MSLLDELLEREARRRFEELKAQGKLAAWYEMETAGMNGGNKRQSS